MQKLYIKFFNATRVLTSGISSKGKDAILFLCCAFLIYIYFFDRRNLDIEPVYIMAIGTAVTFIMVVFSVRDELHEVEWDRPCYYSLVLFGLLIAAVNLLHHPVGSGYMVLALDLALIYPALYFVWGNRRDYDSLYTILSAAALILGLAVFAYCFYMALTGTLYIRDGRVAAHKGSPNFLGFTGAVCAMAGSYLLLKFFRSRHTAIASAAGIGGGISLTLVSLSRTSMISAAICLITVFVFAAKRMIRRKRNTGRVFGRKTAVLMVIIMAVTAATLIAGLKMDNLNNSVSGRADRAGAEAVQNAGESEAEVIKDRLLPTEKRDYSSGRMKIWNIYIRNITAFGRPFETIEDELKSANETRAHNNFLEYSFRCGYISGLIYAVFFIITGLKGLKYLVDLKICDAGHAFSVMIIGSYAVNAMLEIAALPFIRVIPCIFFLTAAPLLQQREGAYGNNQTAREIRKRLP